MKLKTRVQEVEAILITASYGPLKIININHPVTTDELTVGIGEYLIFDPVRGIQKMDAKEVKRLYMTEDGVDPAPEVKPEKKKGTRGKKTGLGNGVTGSRTTYNSDEISTVAD